MRESRGVMDIWDYGRMASKSLLLGFFVLLE
jgi:hypothetical protein